MSKNIKNTIYNLSIIISYHSNRRTHNVNSFYIDKKECFVNLVEFINDKIENVYGDGSDERFSNEDGDYNYELKYNDSEELIKKGLNIISEAYDGCEITLSYDIKKIDIYDDNSIFSETLSYYNIDYKD